MQPDRDIWAARDKLPVERSWYHDHDGRTDLVRVALGAVWPQIHVRIRPHRSDIEYQGAFSATGRLYALGLEAVVDSAEVTTADLRRSAIVRALKEWEIVGRRIAEQYLAGTPPEKVVFDTRSPTEALRMLSQPATGRGSRSTSRKIRRGGDHDELLRQIAAAYKAELRAGNPRPRLKLAADFGYTVPHIGWLLSQARKPLRGQPPLLGPARPGKAGEEPAESSPDAQPIAGRGAVQPSPFGPDRRGEAGVQPIVAAIVTSARGVLVGRRNDRTPPWTFIAGEMEPGERPEDTAVREVKEETGLEIEAGQVIGERDHPTTGRHMIYLAGYPVRGTDVFIGDEAELAEVKWASLAEADELLPGMFEPVRDYLERELGGTA